MGAKWDISERVLCEVLCGYAVLLLSLMTHAHRIKIFSLCAHGAEKNIRPGTSDLSSSLNFVILYLVILGTLYHSLYVNIHKVKVGWDQWFWNFAQRNLSIFNWDTSGAPKGWGMGRLQQSCFQLAYVLNFSMGFFKRTCFKARNRKVWKLLS